MIDNTGRDKIIPFPGVPLNQIGMVQNTPDGFLNETGYIESKEAPKVRGFPQSDGFQNEVDNFLREMGYIG